MDSFTTFNAAEIAAATGMASDAIRRRANTRIAQGKLPFGKNEWTYPQIKDILRREKHSGGAQASKSEAKVAVLKQWLKADGFRVNP